MAGGQQGPPEISASEAKRLAREEKRVAKEEERRVAREARLKSDYLPFKGEDYAAGIGRGPSDPRADREHKQMYSVWNGEYVDFLKAAGPQDPVPPHLEKFHELGGEEERRYQNRRVARHISVVTKNETRLRNDFVREAKAVLTGLVQPAGYALRPPSPKPASRTAVILLSDLHIGAELAGSDNPEPFTAVEESRRLGKIAYEVGEYKMRHRSETELCVLLNGDLIEGQLGHDQRAGAPCAQQMVAFIHYFTTIMGFWARLYPKVRVYCQVGNHGRNIARHPGRATASKWDSLEWVLYQNLRAACCQLQNVEWHIPQRAVSIVDLYGSKLLLTHGDTEVNLKHPDTGATHNANEMHKINSTQIYGCQFAVMAFGHFHTSRYQAKRPTAMLANGAMVPPNGYARSSGYTDEKCAQWLWEAVPGYPIGDIREIEFGPAEDRDPSLNAIVKPFTPSED